MSSFLSNIIGRHTHPENRISPRPRGLFEKEQLTSQKWASPVHVLPEQEPSLTEAKHPGLKDPENASSKGRIQDTIPHLVDSSLPKTRKDEYSLNSLNPSTEKNAYPIVRKINLKENSDKKPNPEGTPSPPVSPIPKEKGYNNQSTDQKLAFRIRNEIHQAQENPSLATPGQRNKEENKSVEKTPNVSKHFQDPAARSKSFSQKFIDGHGAFPDNIADNTDLVREFQNSHPLQQKNVGTGGKRLIKNENKQLPSTVRITIGRIEIRAVNQQKSTIQKTREPSKVRISLNDFLDKKGNS